MQTVNRHIKKSNNTQNISITLKHYNRKREHNANHIQKHENHRRPKHNKEKKTTKNNSIETTT